MYTAADGAEFALRFVGSLTPYDTAADPENFEVALKHFNLMLAEKIGTRKYWWCVPGQQEITLESGESEYELATQLGDGDPLIMVQDAHLIKDGILQNRVQLIRKWQFDQEYDPDNNPGTPDRLYVTRAQDDASPVAFLLDTPDVDGLTLRLTGLVFPEDLTADGGSGETRFPDAWMRYLALETAVDIGAGPVISLPAGRHDRLVKMALRAERKLNAFNNRENVQGPRYTKPRRF